MLYTWSVLPLLRFALETLFQGHRQVTVAPEVETWATLCQHVQADAVGVEHVIIMDFASASELSREDIHTVKSHKDSVHILFVLSEKSDDEAIVHALRAGVDGYLLQSAEPATVRRAVLNLASGQGYLEPQMTSTVLAELRKPVVNLRTDDVMVPLTDREQALVQLAADGLSNAEMAKVLGVQQKTIHNGWAGLFDKLKMNDKTQAVLWAIRTGYAELRE